MKFKVISKEFVCALILLISLFSCGPTRVVNCPPKFTIYKRIEKAFPVYTKEFNVELKNSLSVVDKIQDTISLNVKNKVIKLRQDLDNISSQLEIFTKANLISYFAGICSPDVRNNFMKFQSLLLENTSKMNNLSNLIISNRSPGDLESKIEESDKIAQDILSSLK